MADRREARASRLLLALVVGRTRRIAVILVVSCGSLHLVDSKYEFKEKAKKALDSRCGHTTSYFRGPCHRYGWDVLNCFATRYETANIEGLVLKVSKC